MKSIKGKPTIFLILYTIAGFLHILIPAWGIIIPDIGASFYWYWGFYFAGSGGHTGSGIIADEAVQRLNDLEKEITSELVELSREVPKKEDKAQS